MPLALLLLRFAVVPHILQTVSRTVPWGVVRISQGSGESISAEISVHGRFLK